MWIDLSYEIIKWYQTCMYISLEITKNICFCFLTGSPSDDSRTNNDCLNLQIFNNILSQRLEFHLSMIPWTGLFYFHGILFFFFLFYYIYFYNFFFFFFFFFKSIFHLHIQEIIFIYLFVFYQNYLDCIYSIKNFSWTWVHFAYEL